MADSRISEPTSLISENNMEDYTTALQLQINCLKECCQKLKEERDAAKIDYAVAEGKLLARDCESHCRDCCLKDEKISHLEGQLEAAKLENAQWRGQLDDTKMRLHQYEKKKRKRKPSQLLQHHDYQNGPIISPTTDSESVPVRSPFQPATCRATEDSACDRLCALKDVLYKDDQLVKELAESFEPTCIQGDAQSGSWKDLCNHLNICPTNLLHVDPKSRLLDILKEYQKTSENDISVKELRKIFKDVGNRNSACRLFRVAQLHMIPSNQATPHEVEDLNNEDYDVSDSDLDSSSSEDWVVV